MDQRPRAIFVGDAPGLGFPQFNRDAGRHADRLDRWTAMACWTGWNRRSSSPPMRSSGFGRSALPGELDKVADQARSLREWFRSFVRKHKGRPLTAKSLAELEPLNRLLERDDFFQRVVPGPRGEKTSLQLQTIRRWRTPEALLSPIGEALAQLVCTEDFSDVKACEGPACTLLFADHTRGRTRRWCSMALCGNRAKQAAHRHRLKEQH